MILMGKRQVKAQRGFTLVELVVAILVVSILGAIAYPNYVNSIARTKRRAAEACLSSYTTYMERWYATNLRYDQDLAGNAITLPTFDCAATQTRDYSFGPSGTITATAYTIQAQPLATNKQSTRDARCGTLTLNYQGVRGASGTDGPDKCW